MNQTLCDEFLKRRMSFRPYFMPNPHIYNNIQKSVGRLGIVDLKIYLTIFRYVVLWLRNLECAKN